MDVGSIVRREIGLGRLNTFRRSALASVHSSRDYMTINSKEFLKSITGFQLNSTENFLLMSDNEGQIYINDIVDEVNGQTKNVISRKFKEMFANCAQWYPHDDGMLQVGYSKCVCLVDTNSMKVCETHKFNCEVFWSDWSRPDPNRIAVGCSGSSVRIIDIRSGNSLQQITLATPLGSQNSSATQVLWDQLDPDCLLVGDSYGYIHIYDVRFVRDSLQMACCDQNVCDAITCMQFTRDKMGLITCHGIESITNNWQFRNKKLVSLNINYVNAYPKLSTRHHSKLSALYVKYQVFLTDQHIFRPAVFGRGVDLVVNHLWSGEMVNSFTSENHSRKQNVTAVAGTSSCQTLFTGGHHVFDTWVLDLYPN